MRIFKSTDSIDSIVGEMLNIEASGTYYDKGARTKEVVKGYPKFTLDGVQHTIAAAEGYIYISGEADFDNIQRYLAHKLDEIGETDPRLKDHLFRFHTANLGYHTNVKLKSNMQLTSYNEDRKTRNIKRQFCVDGDTLNNGGYRGARFTWRIEPISNFNYEIRSDNMPEVISRHLCSVFWDRKDITVLKSGDIITELKLSHFRGYNMTIDHPTISLATYPADNPAFLMLNKYWKEQNDFDFHNIQRNKLYQGNYKDFKIRATKISDASIETSIDICYKCKQKLFGDFYLLMMPYKNPDSQMAHAICPYCLHGSDAEKPIESKYARIFRVSHPVPLTEHIDNDESLTPGQKLALKDSLLGVQQRTTCIGNVKDKNYLIIGNNHIGFNNIYNYLYSDLNSGAEANGRRKLVIIDN